MSAPRYRRIGLVPWVLLVAFAVLPMALWLVPEQWWRGDFTPPAQPRVEIVRAEGRRGAAPTSGMTIGPAGYGTVTEAPFVLARSAAEDGAQGTVPRNSIAPDIARFVRGLPRETRTHSESNEPIMCTMEAPPHYAGRIVLIDGCLRFQDAASGEPGPLVLGIASVHRDAEGYLAVGLRDAAPEYEIRVGEPGGVFIGVGCSRDRPVPAPPALAQACGTSTMRRLGVIKRKPLCGEAELARLEQLRREHAAVEQRLRAEAAACIASGRRAEQCPPPVAPPPPELFSPACRLAAP